MRPNWWHLGGNKVRLVTKVDDYLFLKSATASLEISRKDDPDYWEFHWVIDHVVGSVEGWFDMGRMELVNAFGLTNRGITASGQALANRYGADVAEPGMFIRRGDYLNLPGPGTGLDGDANFSLKLSDDIKIAIKNWINDVDRP